MADFLTKEDLESHIYSDIITEIVRGNDAITQKAISAAVAEAKSYLRKYDLEAIFDPTFEDENLKDKVKDLACWKLVKLSNPNIDMSLFKALYDDAVSWFRDIMKGQADPAGWPYKADDPATPDFEGSFDVTYSSNKKRTQHF